MAGLLPINPRQGNRLEYLANYVLSAFGTAVPVIRTEDVGVDFYCAMGTNAQVGITIEDSYAVQLKSGVDPHMILGGSTNGGTWRDYEINWFLNLEIPLFLGVPNRAEKRLDLYSTSLVRWIAAKPKLPYQVKVIPGSRGRAEAHIHPDQTGLDSGKVGLPDNCDGKIYEFNIGPPFISCCLDDLDDAAKVVQFQTILKQLIKSEQLNSIYRRLRLPYWTWLVDVETNLSHSLAFAYAAGCDGATPDDLLAEIVPFICSLAMTYRNTGNEAKFTALRGIAQLIPRERIPSGVYDQVKQLFE